jgi:hypothetical protein
MSRRTKNSRKRERQKRRHVLRESTKKLIAARISTTGLIGELAQPLHTIAFREALEAQSTKP